MKVKLHYLWVILFCCQWQGAFAQTTPTLRQVLVLNEGRYDYLTGEIIVPVSVGSYDPATRQYQTVATIAGARFASDLQIKGDYYYVAADSFLQKYSLATHQLVANTIVKGIRKLGITDQQIIATRGEYLTTFDAYVQVFDAADLSLQYTLPAATSGIQYASEGVVIHEQKAYIAINNGFEWGNEVGQLAILDLATQQVSSVLSLGDDAKNPDNLMLYQNEIYTLNNKDFTGSSISRYDIATGTIHTSNLVNVSAGCGTSALYFDKILYQELGNTELNTFSTASQSYVGAQDLQKQFYGLGVSPLDGKLYATTTDFVNYGAVYIFDENFATIDSFTTSVAPSSIGFDVVNTVGAATPEAVPFTLLPNPAATTLQIGSEHLVEQAEIWTITGVRVLHTLQPQHLSIAHLPNGTYYVKVRTAGGGIGTQRLVIQH